jgi:hypothetical protein
MIGLLSRRPTAEEIYIVINLYRSFITTFCTQIFAGSCADSCDVSKKMSNILSSAVFHAGQKQETKTSTPCSGLFNSFRTNSQPRPL